MAVNAKDIFLCTKHLASDESKFVTGSELVIDDGLSAGIFQRK